MKYLNIKNLIAIVFVLAISVGCNKEKERNLQVSTIISNIDNPYFIGTLTPQNLIDKSGITDGVLPFTYETLIGFFMLENETGIDNNTKIQIVSGSGEGFLPSFYGIFKIKDSDKFSVMMQKELNAEIQEKDKMKYIIKDMDSYVIVWNDEFAIATNIQMSLMDIFSKGDKGGQKAVNTAIRLIQSAYGKEMNDKYVDFLNKDADLAMYFDAQNFYEYWTSSPLVSQADMKEYKDYYKDSYFESFLNFEKGNVNWKFNFNFSEKVLADVDFMGEKGVKNEILNFSKSENPIFTYAMNLNASSLYNYIDKNKNKSFEELEKALEEYNLEIKDLESLLTGELLIMIDDIVQKSEMMDFGYGEPYEFKSSEPVIGMVVGLKTSDISNFLIKDDIKLLPSGIYVMDKKSYMVVSGSYLFVSNDQKWAEMVAANQTYSIQGGKDNLTSHPLAMFSNIGKINPKDNQTLQIMYSIYESFWMKANLTEAEFNLVLKDKSLNSLRVITQMFSDMMNEEEMSANKQIKDILEKEVAESNMPGFEEEDFKELKEKTDVIIKELDKIVTDVKKESGK